MYSCDLCDNEDKEKRGCEKENETYKAEFKCICDGVNDKCAVCEGKGKFTLTTCPVKYLNDKYVNFLLPYFFQWKSSEYRDYPDGKSLMMQPVKMISAFNVMLKISSEREVAQIKNNQSK